MNVRLGRQSFMALVFVGVGLVAIPPPSALYGQDAGQDTLQGAGQKAATPPIGQQKLTAYARAYLQIGAARGEIQAQFAETGNKTDEAQARLREQLRQRISGILEQHGLTPEEYQRITLLVSVDQAQREAFDQVLATLNEGGPTSGSSS